MDQRVWWSWKGHEGEDTSSLVPVDEDTQALFVQEALGWGKVVVQGNFFQTHGLLYSQVGHCIQVAMGQGSLQNIRRCKIFQVDLCEPIAKPVAAALAVYHNLTKLKLCELNISLVTVHSIFDALQSNEGLQTLVLDSVYMEDEAWMVVGRALARNKTLQHLRLRRTLSATGLEAVCTIIINNKNLKSLDISDNRIGDEGMMHLLKALTVNYCIERVVLSSNAFGDHGAHVLAMVVQQSKTLTLLDVDSNNIGKMGARELGPALAANTSLQVLRLSRNFLDDASVTSIAVAAGRHKKLEQLDLSFNRMGPEGVSALAQQIVRPGKAVDSLLLHGNCMIGNDGALHLARVLPRARKLTRLDLSDCEIGDKGALALAKGLARNKSLLDFRIAHNQITHEGAAAFAAALRQNTTLKYFDFSFNWVGHRGITPLKEVQAQVSERCHMVWELSLEYCQIEKFKYGDYTSQQDDTTTHQDQQDAPSPGRENLNWLPHSGAPSDNDTHVTSTLTAISESRLDLESTQAPLSTRALSVTDGAPAHLNSSTHTDCHTSGTSVTTGSHLGNGVILPPMTSLPEVPPLRADSFESVSLGAVPPSPLGEDPYATTPSRSDGRNPFQLAPSVQKSERDEEGEDKTEEVSSGPRAMPASIRGDPRQFNGSRAGSALPIPEVFEEVSLHVGAVNERSGSKGVAGKEEEASSSSTGQGNEEGSGDGLLGVARNVSIDPLQAEAALSQPTALPDTALDEVAITQAGQCAVADVHATDVALDGVSLTEPVDALAASQQMPTAISGTEPAVSETLTSGTAKSACE